MPHEPQVGPQQRETTQSRYAYDAQARPPHCDLMQLTRCVPIQVMLTEVMLTEVLMTEVLMMEVALMMARAEWRMTT